MRLGNGLFIAVLAGLSVASASAQDRGDRFVQRDGNGDGVLELHEYQGTGGHPGNFRALDTDGDGVLSEAEFVGRGGVAEGQAEVYEPYAKPNGARVKKSGSRDVLVKTSDTGAVARGGVYQKAPAGSAFRARDLNQDGVLSRREYGQASTFERVDRNRDGRITYGEFRNPAGR